MAGYDAAMPHHAHRRAPTDDHPAVQHAARYDRIAEGYARWWAPVLADTAVALLDHIDPDVARGAREIVDIGTGTGTLALAAIERWPDVRVLGVDASAGMAARAEAEADACLGPADRARFETRVAFADELPLDDASIDLAISSFVLQLVPDRGRALREARRVLRPGGRLAYVTWLRSERAFAPDAIVDEVLQEEGFDPREPDPRPGDLPSIPAAVAQMRRAGFADVAGEPATLVKAWDAEGFVAFLEEFDEESTFDELGGRRASVRSRLVDRLSRLDADELTMRLPVAYLAGSARERSSGSVRERRSALR
jgi:ubiquinone/menaquinone biosynthesis C-methylase UbiE